MTRRVLVIEDDPDIGRLVALHLGDIGCTAEVATSGEDGLRRFTRDPHDLVVLDLMLPAMDGLAVCRELRQRPGYVPILMLTARSSELDRVLGLEIGADDYLTKPFAIAELMARVKALLRRVEALTERDTESPSHVGHRDLDIDTERREVRIGSAAIDLTAREFDLLLHFARHPGRVFTRAQLLDVVWGYGHDGYEHTVNTHINRLRAKIEDDPARPRRVVTVWGVGYKLADD